MFRIRKFPFGEYTLVKIENNKTGEYFSFLSDYGASLNQLVLQGSDGINHELFYGNQDYEDLVEKGKSIYKGSKLFPFPNRIDSGKYQYANQEYQLPINHLSEGHAIHGLIFDKQFSIINEYASEEKGVVTLEYNYDNECEGYPFKFNINIIFEMSTKGVSCTTIVKNMDACNIPVGDGWHPYFKTESGIDKLSISIPASLEVETDNLMIPTGLFLNALDFNESKHIGDKHFDTCFKLHEDASKSVVKIIDAVNSINLNIWMESGDSKYKYVQIYTPESRDCIAVEPMTCMPDAFNNKRDLIILAPNEKIKLLWGVYLS